MLRHRAGIIAFVLGLQALPGLVPSREHGVAAAPQDPPAWWFCRAVGKRAISGDAVLLYADSASRIAPALGRANTASHVFHAPRAAPDDVREQFLATARKHYPEVINWRATCDGFATQDAATRADKASRARDRAAFPPAEWFALQGFTYRRS
jgi:hypothetical protein